MLFTSSGLIDGHFLQFAAASFHYSTGYDVSFLGPDGRIELPLPTMDIREPYEGYLSKKLSNLKHEYAMNAPHLVYLDYQELVIVYPISHRERYLGAVIVGPMSVKSLSAKDAMNQSMYATPHAVDQAVATLLEKQLIHEKQDNPLIKEGSNQKKESKPKEDWTYTVKNSRYQQQLPMIQQFQIQYLTNLVNLVMHSDYYDPTVISTLPIVDKEVGQTPPSAEKISGRLIHHSVDQEEKILQQILISDDSFTKLAMRHISKLSNLVAPPLADDPLRSEQNRFVVSATIVSRAAIKLGMPSDLAFSYSDYFINAIEGCQDLSEVWDLQMSMFAFYRKEVKKSRSKTYFNPATNLLLGYIENNIETNQSLQEICKHLDLDYKYASNCFKKDTGLGFNKYLTKEKMVVAQKELATTETPVQIIAENLGYNNAYYFTRTFKSTFGLSPTEYRKRSVQ